MGKVIILKQTGPALLFAESPEREMPWRGLDFTQFEAKEKTTTKNTPPPKKIKTQVLMLLRGVRQPNKLTTAKHCLGNTQVPVKGANRCQEREANRCNRLLKPPTEHVHGSGLGVSGQNRLPGTSSLVPYWWVGGGGVLKVTKSGWKVGQGVPLGFLPSRVGQGGMLKRSVDHLSCC